MYNLVKNKISSTLVQLTVHFFNETKRKTNTNYIDVELAGHVHKLDVKLQSLCGSGFYLTWNCRVCVEVGFLCLLCACLPNLTTLEWIDQQRFAKTKMGYISLPLNLNAIIGITSHYCVILKIVILHDTMKTIHNGVFVFFFNTNKNLFLVKKNKKIGLKKTGGLFFY